MRWRLVLGGFVLAGTLLLAGAATGGPKPLQRGTPRAIEAIAMDGSRVAYDVSGGLNTNGRTYTCNSVYVWSLISGTVTRVSGKGTCDADTTSTGAGVRELALAGDRAAWIVNTGGNSESDDDLYTASLPRPKEHRLATATRSGPEDPVVVGDWIGGLVGAGKFLGVNRWSTDSQGNVTSTRLQAIRTGLRTIGSGVDTMKAGATDGKQIAVLRVDGTVGLYSTAGRLVRVVTPTSAKQVAVRATGKDRIVVLTKAKGRIPPPTIIGVQLEPVGLVYATNRATPSGWAGLLTFKPMAQLASRA